MTAQKFLDSSKLKEFADDNFKFDENGRKLSKQVQNIVGKGEIARFKRLVCQRGQKVSLSGNGLMGIRVQKKDLSVLPGGKPGLYIELSKVTHTFFKIAPLKIHIDQKIVPSVFSKGNTNSDLQKITVTENHRFFSFSL